MKNYPPSINDFIDFDKSGGIFFVHCPERYVLKSMKSEISFFIHDFHPYARISAG